MPQPRVVPLFRSSLRTLSHTLGVILFLFGCHTRGTLEVEPTAAPPGSLETVLVATSRVAVVGPPYFSSKRSPSLQFAKFEVSVPPDRELGTVTFPRGDKPDPLTDFLVVSADKVPGAGEFRREIDRQLSASPSALREASVYVHGFNTNFAEGLMRQVQLQHDLDRRTAAIHFAWPSTASVTGYLTDRESVLHSRRALEETIAIVAASQAGSINLIAHSMGTLLLVDTVHQMARLGYDEVFKKVNAVILFSPDIEVDVFKVLAPAILERGVPIVVFLSRKDRALALSAAIRRENDRLGSLRSIDELGGLPVQVYDVTDVRDGDHLDHYAFATSPALLSLMRGVEHTSVDFLDYTQPPGVGEAAYMILNRGTNLILEPFVP